ncbi:MAG TPA: type II toxin-antitoxin system VapC family toxin [Candidatus Paceibacterota bacterium]|nr:type II toxin-antitoxin system VapC family toxin [Candidatus Paceibacterota bacterium]
MNWYLDSSAILKLIFQEDESNALVRTITDQCVTSSISRIEVIRIVQRTNPGSLGFAREELSKLILVPISEAVIRIAESFAGLTTLRSLDAIHVASALLVQNSIGGLITYDMTMARNARELGLVVQSPA